MRSAYLKAAYLGLAMLSVEALAADEIEATLHEYSYCLVCHGYDVQGNPVVTGPALAGIELWYLEAALNAYRSGQRHTSPAALEMQAAARMVSAEDTERLYRLFSQLPRLVEKPSPTADLSRGAAAYDQFCAVCHGPNAEGNSLVASPSLTRLNSWYLASSWQAFQHGPRGDEASSPTAQQMRAIAQAVPADFPIDDVIAHILSFNP